MCVCALESWHCTLKGRLKTSQVHWTCVARGDCATPLVRTSLNRQGLLTVYNIRTCSQSFYTSLPIILHHCCSDRCHQHGDVPFHAALTVGLPNICVYFHCSLTSHCAVHCTFQITSWILRMPAFTHNHQDNLCSLLGGNLYCFSPPACKGKWLPNWSFSTGRRVCHTASSETALCTSSECQQLNPYLSSCVPSSMLPSTLLSSKVLPSTLALCTSSQCQQLNLCSVFTTPHLQLSYTCLLLWGCTVYQQWAVTVEPVQCFHNTSPPTLLHLPSTLRLHCIPAVSRDSWTCAVFSQHLASNSPTLAFYSEVALCTSSQCQQLKLYTVSSQHLAFNSPTLAFYSEVALCTSSQCQQLKLYTVSSQHLAFNSPTLAFYSEVALCTSSERWQLNLYTGSSQHLTFNSPTLAFHSEVALYTSSQCQQLNLYTVSSQHLTFNSPTLAFYSEVALYTSSEPWQLNLYTVSSQHLAFSSPTFQGLAFYSEAAMCTSSQCQQSNLYLESCVPSSMSPSTLLPPPRPSLLLSYSATAHSWTALHRLHHPGFLLVQVQAPPTLDLLTAMSSRPQYRELQVGPASWQQVISITDSTTCRTQAGQCQGHTSAPRSCTPDSAMGTKWSCRCTSKMVLPSTGERRSVSRWLGIQRCTTVPSMPDRGTHTPQPVFPPFCRHSSRGHCRSSRRPRLMESYTWLGSTIWNHADAQCTNPWQKLLQYGDGEDAASHVGLFVGWLLNVPATGQYISGTDLLRQFYVLPHWDRSWRSNVLPHPVTVYWHRADQSQCWPYNARRLAG